jgi:CheY-like chemotaxis protein
VERFNSADFDLILTDLRMPVMDGLAATRAMRALERERGAAPIPIIVLSANACLQDIEKSMDAGCNVHLTKPISKLTLIGAIEKHRRQPESAAASQSGSCEPISIEMPTDIEDLVPGYLAARRREIGEMNEILAASDFASLSRLGHNLKGTASGYGFPDLVWLGCELEPSANQMDRETLHTRITELGNYLDRVKLIPQPC